MPYGEGGGVEEVVLFQSHYMTAPLVVLGGGVV